MSMFKKATRKQSKLRLALIGPSGSGKTMSALLIASALGKRVAVIDSERGSASLYAGEAGEFDVLELEDFSPQRYVDAIKAAEREGYDVIVVDSLSHAWMGKGGALEMVDQAAKRSTSKNSFDAWRSVTPAHNALVDAMVQSKAHIIATVRSKTEYVLEENERGKKVPRKVGMAPIQRDGLEYEFTLVGEMDQEHNLVVSKTRCHLVDGAVINKPGAQLAETLKVWLDGGEELPVGAPVVEPAGLTTEQQAQADAGVALVQKHFPEARVAFDYEAAIKQCTKREHLVELARVLLEECGPVSGKPAWRAFATACAGLECPPREVVAEAQKASAA